VKPAAMFRLSPIMRKARCLYDVLGVPSTATAAEIKQAFRKQAKQTHPDMAASTDASKRFREIVDAYRTLRDPGKRKKYDNDMVTQARRSPGASSEQWPRGYAEDMSEEFRANLYNYPMGETRHHRQADTTYTVQHNFAGAKAEKAAIGVVLFSAVGFFFYNRADPNAYIDKDPYPNRKPSARPIADAAATTKKKLSAVGSITGAMHISPTAPSQSASMIIEPPDISGSATGDQDAPIEDELVRAYYNPFAERWQRIPEGYEAPGAVDLTAWHKKRADPVEWSRLFAEGKLSEIVPRGGLKVRYMQAWDTYEPHIVTDPFTGKTIQAAETLPRTRASQQCDIKF